MQNMRAVSLSVLLLAFGTTAGFTQTKAELSVSTQIDIARATEAVRAAENMGAPIYAKALYDEAVAKLNWSRTNWEDKRREVREDAKVRSVEAYHAARAAEAVARLVGSRSEVLDLRQNISTLGGTVQAISFADVDGPAASRGATSKERVAYAKMILDRARTTTAELVAPEDMRTAAANLETAERLAKTKRINESADSLAYISEMLARRAEALALRQESDAVLPGLRLERTRLAQVASETRARQEREQREAAERQAAELRRQLAEQEASRQAEAAEVARLRTQLEEHNRAMQEQLERDRLARLDAERRLDEMRAQYQTAIGSSSDAAEIERLRRQVEDQAIALRIIQDRERGSEESVAAEVERLRREIERQRTAGGVAAEREAMLQRQQQELERLRTEREANERRREEAERAYAAAVQQAEERRRATEQQAAQLRQEADTQRSRAETAERELTRTREEMDRREQMQRALSAIASTRSDPRGLIVTLPGIFFATGKSTLTPGAQNTLGRIADQLKTWPTATIAIEGHTDSVGSEESNQALSLRRAEAVRDYLVSRGLSANVTVSGKGESTPVAPNTTASGRQQNRRVELVIAQ
jgi:outer membrane protein OmpA-like peptidoglycan-associated protein